MAKQSEFEAVQEAYFTGIQLVQLAKFSDSKESAQLLAKHGMALISKSQGTIQDKYFDEYCGTRPWRWPRKWPFPWPFPWPWWRFFDPGFIDPVPDPLHEALLSDLHLLVSIEDMRTTLHGNAALEAVKGISEQLRGGLR
ncbi:hypothetical protein GCM10010967_32630 [Dyadobacter beijingensis]|uniref:Uncharacterized protein n=1 Tax=Dyadobacter beijingensis TaxID=365489 RepID=A0ABQ2I003_9BACT|nr:hypothetical protein [Dyadobacter beijingensis]GGM96446.1 hypothetical protein GCM10010967_32630 [Dyadobacter beijingensis]